jgi:hypothetical protein
LPLNQNQRPNVVKSFSKRIIFEICQFFARKMRVLQQNIPFSFFFPVFWRNFAPKKQLEAILEEGLA